MNRNNLIIAMFMLSPFLGGIIFLYMVLISYCFYIIQTEKYSIKISDLKKIFLVTLITFFSIISIDINTITLYNVVRDFTYISLPILAILVGLNLKKIIKNEDEIIKLIIFLGVVLGALHIYNYFSSGVESESLYEVRSEVGNGNIITILAICFMIIFYSKLSELYKNKKILLFCYIMILFTSLTLSLSRTFLITIIVCILIYFIYVLRNRFKITNVIMSILIVLFLVPFVYYLYVSNNQVNEFVIKITNSFQEITVSNYITAYEINNNWRGYESFRALMKFNQASIFNKLFGFGLGSSVDLGLEIKLGDNLMSKIPILHNGMLYVLIKSGIIGLVMYSLILIRMLIQSLKIFYMSNNIINCIPLLLSIVLIFNSFTVTGFFNPNFSILLILYFYFVNVSDEKNNFFTTKYNDLNERGRLV